MKKAHQNGVDFPEETKEERATGIYNALAYVAQECNNLGLTFTARIVASAAYTSLGEFEKLHNGEPDKNDGVLGRNPKLATKRSPAAAKDIN